jgi:hypothetical protein
MFGIPKLVMARELLLKCSRGSGEKPENGLNVETALFIACLLTSLTSFRHFF